MTSFFTFDFFGNNSHSASNKAKRQRRGRSCRIEELEGREMLSVNMLGFDVLQTQYDDLDDYDFVETGAAADAIVANAAAPDGYNVHDWDKVEAIKAQGVIVGTSWSNAISTEMRLASISIQGVLDTGSLDLSGCANLSSLNVSGCIALEYLDCSRCRLTSLDVLKHTALTYLDCSFNDLTFSSLLLPSHSIPELHCGGQRLMTIASSHVLGGTLNLSSECNIGDSLTTYTWKYANGSVVPTNFYTETNGRFVFSGLLKGDTIYCEMTNAKYPGLTLLTTNVTISNDSVTDYNANDWEKIEAVKNNSRLTDAGLTWAKVNGEYRLTSISISNSGLAGSLDLSDCTALESLNCQSNQLTSLNVLGCSALTTLSVEEINLTSLDVSSNTALTSLRVSGNNLKTLDISKNTALTSLSVYGTNLTTLNVSNNTALEGLYCDSNKLTSLDVSKNTALIELTCSNNQLTTLDVSKNTALDQLWCSNNKLTTLDMSNNNVLRVLLCGFNQLTSLTFNIQQSCPLFVYDGNPLTTLTVAIDPSLPHDEALDIFGSPLINKTATTYTWKYANGSAVPASSFTNNNGKFTFTGLYDGDVIYCEMSNEQFPGLTLRTTDITIAGLIQLSAPKIVDVISMSDGEVIVTWNNVPKAESYVFQYSTTGTFDDAQSILITNTWISLGILDASIPRYFRVMAIADGICSEWSEMVFTKAALPAPAIDKAVKLDDGEVVITWNSVPNASGYEIEYVVNGLVQTVSTTGTASTWVSLGILDADAAYSFRVKALGSEVYADSSFSVAVSELTQAVRLNTPTLTSVIAGADKISVTWNKVAGASEYLLEYSTDNWVTSNCMEVNGDKTTAVIDDGVMPGANYQFRIMASASGGESGSSEFSGESSVTIPVTTPAPVKPKVKADSKKAAIDRVELTWNAVENVEYVITCQALPDWSKTVTGCSATIDEGLQPGKSYKFTVTAVNADGTAVDAKGKATTVNVTAKTPKYVAPKMKADTKGTIVTGGEALGKTKTSIDSVTLTWATAGRPEGEKLDVKVFDTKAKKEVTPADLIYSTGTDKKGNALTTLTLTGLKATTKYRVEVQAYTGESLDTATEKSALGKPSITTAKYAAVSKVVPTVSGSNLALTWQIPTGTKVAPGAVYTAYEIDWVVSKTERKSVTIDSVATDGNSATVLLSTLETLGIDFTSTKKHNFVIRAVIIAGDTVVNQSLEAKFSFTPSKLLV